MKKERLYAFDNLKFLLIFLVVLGHVLEISADFAGRVLLLRIIYSFHMPVFLFLTGFFAKYDPKKIALRLGWTYVLFQVLYSLFAEFVLKRTGGFSALSTPYWLLWYLFVMIGYELLLPLLDVQRVWQKGCILAGSVALALLSGYDSGLGYTLSGARFFTFLPFFLFGFYCGKRKKIPFAGRPTAVRVAAALCSTAATVAACVCIAANRDITLNMMYGSMSYAALGYSPLQRATVFAAALAWLAFWMLAVLPLLDRRLPVVSEIGRNTFCVFLLHGFLVRLVGKTGLPFAVRSLPLALLLTAAIVVVCGNPHTAWFFSRFFTGRWLEKRLQK